MNDAPFIHDAPNANAEPQRAVFICIPAYGGQLALETHLSCMALAPALYQHGFGSVSSGASYPEASEARNLLTTIWYDTIPTTHMLTVDSDMGFAPDLIMDMLALDMPLVGTVYRHKDDKVSWVGSGLPMPGTFSQVTEKNPIVAGKFLQIEGSGFGITLIRRDCIDAMLAKFPECIDDRIGQHPARSQWLAPRGIKRVLRLFEPIWHPERGRLSEDLSFCSRARAAGIPVMASIGHDVEHVGRKVFSGNFMQHALECEARAHFPAGTPIDTSLSTGTPPTEQVTP